MSEIILTNLSPEALELAVAKRDELADQALGNFIDAVAECGRYLIALEEVSEHGTFGDRLDRCFKKGKSLAYIYMKIGRNFQRVGNLRTAPSLRQAMRLIAEYEEAAGTKRTRKPPADPVPEVEVIDNRPAKPVQQPQAAPAMFDDTGDLPPEEPPPLPRTNTLHSPATQQRIDRGPDPAPPTVIECGAGLTPLQHVLAGHTRREVLAELVSGYEGEQRKRVFADIRAFLDEFDPQPIIRDATEKPVKRGPPAKHPTADQLMFVAEPYATKWSGQLMTQVCKWAEYKQSLAGNAKVRSLASWDAMLTRIDNVQKMRGPGTVCEMINKAIANGWQGWEHDSGSNGKPTVASTRIDSGEDYSDLEYRTE